MLIFDKSLRDPLGVSVLVIFLVGFCIKHVFFFSVPDLKLALSWTGGTAKFALGKVTLSPLSVVIYSF